MHFLQSVLKLKIFINKIQEDFLLIFFLYKMRFSSPQKLFRSDCITLYDKADLAETVQNFEHQQKNLRKHVQENVFNNV